MIKNSKELKIAKENLAGFKRALEEVRKDKNETNARELEVDETASLGLIEKTERDIKEYENLKSEKVCLIGFDSMNNIGEVLIKTRIARGWSQEQLAEKLNIDQQQIHRYESFNYDSVKLSRLIDIISVLNIDIPPCKLRIKKPIFQKPSNVLDDNIENLQESIYEFGFFGGNN